VTLSPGLIPVAQTCLERIERLFDLACDPQQIQKRWANSVLRGQACVYRGRWMRTSRASGDSGQLVSVAMAAKLASRVVALCGEPVADCPGYLCFPRRQRWRQRTRWR
jgi:DNA-3-methyladenine glycosylase II